jgi:hypothetical protein
MKHPADYSHSNNIYPEFPPKGWSIIQDWGDGYALQCKNLRVIIDVRTLEDNMQWLHVSFSRSSYLPSWDDTKFIKECFIGDNEAIMIFPKQEDYVNIHKFCLHLWSPITFNPIPNFTVDFNGIKSI